MTSSLQLIFNILVQARKRGHLHEVEALRGWSRRFPLTT